MKNNYKLFYILLFVLALVVNFAGINVNFFTDDPGLYASISKNLLYHKDIFQLFSLNQDWLDKPHFPFWMVMLSFKIFGVSVWAYRLPALLFFSLSLVYTWLFSKRFYGTEVACIAVLIVTTSLHVLISNTDIRAEPYLMALITGSIYHICRLEERYTFAGLFLASLLTACAIMTKGMFVIVAIYGALLGQLIFQKKLSSLVQIKWLLLFTLTLVFTLPEFYALYIQFDTHPEKNVFYRQNVSGIKWFLWDSQFGRFVNSGPITHKSGSIFFYVHTLLWAFAPWCLLFYYAVYKTLKKIWLKIKLPEYYAISGGGLLLLLFSLSGFQLPFYTNAIFPLFAIITAPFCYEQLGKFATRYRLISEWTYAVLFIIITLAIHILFKPASSIWFIIDCVIFGVLMLMVIKWVDKPHLKAFFITCSAILFANFYLNTTVYGVLASYSGQMKAANYLNRPEFNQYHIYTVSTGTNIFQYYSKRPVDFLPPDNFKQFKPSANSAIFAGKKFVDELKEKHELFRVIKPFENYPQENIIPAFINKATRNKVLDSVYLITK